MSVKLPIFHDLRTGRAIYEPMIAHGILASSTGGGKSTSALHMSHCMAHHMLTTKGNDDRLLIFDYKRSVNWKELRGSQGYYAVDDCLTGFDQLYQIFRQHLSGEEPIGNRLYWVIFDEYSSFVESLEKKVKEDFLRRFAEMLRLSRELGDDGGGFRIWVLGQSVEAGQFGNTGVRGNFLQRIVIGSVSVQNLSMMFEEIEGDPIKPRSSASGRGYYQLMGSNLKRIIFPLETRRELVFRRLLTVMSRPLSYTSLVESS